MLRLKPLKFISFCSKITGASALIAALVFLFLSFFPDTYWARSGVSIRYRPQVTDLRPIIIWDTNVGDPYTESFNITTFLFPNFEQLILFPKEKWAEGWFGGIYVDPQGNAFREIKSFGNFQPMARDEIVSRLPKYNRIIYNNETIFRSFLQRIPELAQIADREKFAPFLPAESPQPLWKAIPAAEKFTIFFRLFVFTEALLLLGSAFALKVFRLLPGYAAISLSLAAALGTQIFSAWVLMECGLYSVRGVLLTTGLAGLLGVAWIFRSRPFDFTFRKLVHLDSRVSLFVLTLIFIACQFKLYGIVLHGDITRYFDQARFVDWFGSWPREHFIKIGMRGSHEANYPMSVGFLFSWSSFLSGTPLTEMMHPGWRFSVSYILISFIYGFINFLAAGSLWAYRRVIGTTSALFLTVAVLNLPTFRGFNFGPENVVWPCAMIAWLGLDFAYFRREKATLLLLLPLIFAYVLSKNEGFVGLAGILFPALVLRAWMDRRAGWRGVPSIFFTLALGGIPYLIFKFLNSRAGINTTGFAPVSPASLVELLPYLKPVAQTAWHSISHDFYPAFYGILAAGIATVIVTTRQTRTLLTWTGLATLVSTVYFSFWVVVYMHSNYATKTLHVQQSFDRVYLPAAFILGFIPLAWGVRRTPVSFRSKS